MRFWCRLNPIQEREIVLIQIQANGSWHFDESFMNSIFSKIHTSDKVREVPLGPLEQAMFYHYEVTQTPAVNRSEALPFDKLHAEQFYPVHKENSETTNSVILMASKVDEAIVKELCDPKKATTIHLASVEGV